MTELEKIRLDKWLWAARFYKTRKLAADAVSGGKVHLNGQRSKPGKDVKIGSQLVISKDHLNWTITIVALNKQRRPSKEALLLYQESSESITAREQKMILQKQQRLIIDHTRDNRPNKKQRRQIHRFKQG